MFARGASRRRAVLLGQIICAFPVAKTVGAAAAPRIVRRTGRAIATTNNAVDLLFLVEFLRGLAVFLERMTMTHKGPAIAMMIALAIPVPEAFATAIKIGGIAASTEDGTLMFAPRPQKTTTHAPTVFRPLAWPATPLRRKGQPQPPAQPNGSSPPPTPSRFPPSHPPTLPPSTTQTCYV